MGQSALGKSEHSWLQEDDSCTSGSGFLLVAGRTGSGEKRQLGDKQLAKTVVLGLVNQIGFDGVDGGGLDDSWRRQPGTPAYCTDLDIEGVVRVARAALALAKKEGGPAWRATASKLSRFAKPA